MRGGALPPALLCAALGFALAFAPRRSLALCLAVLAAAAVTMALIGVPSGWREGAFLGCWTSVVLTAACVHLPSGPGRSGAVLLSLNAGVWAGAVIAVAGARLDLLEALPCALVALPAAWVVAKGGRIGVKVVASWLIAVALLAGALQLLPITPGYVPDHMD